MNPNKFNSDRFGLILFGLIRIERSIIIKQIEAHNNRTIIN